MLIQSEWLSILAIVLSVGIPALALAMRSAIVAYINQKTRAMFERELESVRSDLRRSEEVFKSDLQSKERRFTTLVETTFSDRTARRDKIAARKIEALESIWLKFQSLSVLKASATLYQTFKIDVLEKEAPRNQKLQDMLNQMFKHDLPEIANSGRATFERIYIPDIIWAIHTAYSSILLTLSLHLKAISLGIEDSGKLISWDKVKLTVLAVLPHQSEFIEKFGGDGLTYLLDEIESLMLKEVRAALDGDLDDRDSLSRAKDILEAAQNLSATTQAQTPLNK